MNFKVANNNHLAVQLDNIYYVQGGQSLTQEQCISTQHQTNGGGGGGEGGEG